MGIPSFYRWLVERYPLCVVDVLEEVPTFVNGVKVPTDTSLPNPNGIEFDNLYLDMNGIVHPCFHPENQPAPDTYDDVFKAIFEYIDRIFTMIRPRVLLFMAIDGVAPRAKMNQQRGRRFRAAKDAADAAAEAEKLRAAFESEGKMLKGLMKTKTLDSNVITPGTEFMAALSSALQYYVHLRLNSDLGWRGIKVILSDASVPGEGEHKIMSYIRLQRNLPGFNPNTRHCLYGLDADLIMLALATHEVHFTILREDVRAFQQNGRSQKFGEHTPSNAQKFGGGSNGDHTCPPHPFQFLNIWVLRDYLEHDLRVPNSSTKTDLERLIDDFVFMCVFVGNDFLPHLPSLEISEGAIDLLMSVYKKEFVRMGGYLTNSFEVNLERLEHFIQAVGFHENGIFRRRTQLQKEREIYFKGVPNVSSWGSSRPSRERMDTPSYQASELQRSTNGFHRLNGSVNNGAIIDKVKLGEEGWKERFYAEKFQVKTVDEFEKLRRHAVLKYAEGLCWVMHYYYQGVCSWQWFYPYHYAPFASDFYGLDQLEMHFTLGKPFKPFDQLMGVLPSASAHALPLFYRKLMIDPSSPIADLYPSDFEIDMNGKRHTWQAVCKLPFIKESRLLAEIAKVEHTLTEEEKDRNSLGMDMLLVNDSHPLAAKIISCCQRNKDHPKLLKAKIKKKIDPEISGGMNGYVYISDRTARQRGICSPIAGMGMIRKNHVITVFYKFPPFHPHIPRPPKGVIIPGKLVSKRDVLPVPILWHEKTAVLGRLFIEGPVPKSISGPSLAKLAHQLVSKYYLEQKQEDLDADLQVGAKGSSFSHSKQSFGDREENGDGSFMKGKGKKRKQDDGDRSTKIKKQRN